MTKLSEYCDKLVDADWHFVTHENVTVEIFGFEVKNSVQLKCFKDF